MAINPVQFYIIQCILFDLASDYLFFDHYLMLPVTVNCSYFSPNSV